MANSIYACGNAGQSSLAGKSSLAGAGASLTSQGEGHGYGGGSRMTRGTGQTASHGQLPSMTGSSTHQPSNVLGSSYSHGLSSSQGMAGSASQPSLHHGGSYDGSS